jgi:uncharacterized UPF0160 family protein
MTETEKRGKPQKKNKPKPPRVGTHSGTPHLDEEAAVAILSLALGVNPSEVVRSRSPSELSSCDILVDVGGAYDPDAGMFDHHQWKTKGNPPDGPARWNGVPFASAGLVWKKYGRDAIRNVLSRLEKGAGEKLTEDWIVREVEDSVDFRLIAPIDAADVRYRMDVVVEDGAMKWVPGGTPGSVPMKWGMTVLPALGKLAHQVLPTWLEPNYHPDSSFVAGCLMVRGVIRREIIHVAAKKLGDRLLLQAMERTQGHHRALGILVLDKGFEWDTKAVHEGRWSYVVEPSGKKWAVKAITTPGTDWVSENPIPESWCGLHGESLDAELGGSVPDGAVFAKGGFVAIHNTKGGAVAMAEQAAMMAKAARESKETGKQPKGNERIFRSEG